MSVSKLLLMALLHFIAMYFLMYAMVNTANNIFLNLNNAYMAVIMTAPMLILEGLVMGSMYQPRKSLMMVLVGATVIFISFFLFIRQQVLITDKEFIRSMIPHHSGAILMCERAKISNPELQSLCEQIIDSQQTEIDRMKSILSRLQ